VLDDYQTLYADTPQSVQSISYKMNEPY
jgi:hypothetical protein